MSTRGRKDKPIVTPQTALEAIGARLRQERQRKGIRLTAMAPKVNYTDGWLSAVENGKRMPARQLVEQYEAALGLAPGELTALWDELQQATRTHRAPVPPTSVSPPLGPIRVPPRGGLRFGSGYDVAPSTHADHLRAIQEQLADLQHHLAQLSQLVVDLLQQEAVMDVDDETFNEAYCPPTGPSLS